MGISLLITQKHWGVGNVFNCVVRICTSRSFLLKTVLPDMSFLPPSPCRWSGRCQHAQESLSQRARHSVLLPPPLHYSLSFPCYPHSWIYCKSCHWWKHSTSQIINSNSLTKVFWRNWTSNLVTSLFSSSPSPSGFYSPLYSVCILNDL